MPRVNPEHAGEGIDPGEGVFSEGVAYRQVSRRNVLAGAGGAIAAFATGGALARHLGIDEAHAAAVDGTSGTLSLTEGSMLQLAVSPDRDTILMNLLGMLWTLPVTGGTAKKLTGLHTDPAYPSWSPQGGSIAFQSYMDGTFHIWSMKPDGSQLTQLTSGGWDDREPVYSPDGRRIAFSSDRNGGEYNIWVLDVASGRLSQVTRVAPGSSAFFPTWSPDGSEVAFVERDRDGQAIKAADVSGTGTLRTLQVHDTGQVFCPTWSPEGSGIAYVLQGGPPSDGHHPDQPALPQLMLDGKPLTDTEDVFTFPPQWLGRDTLLYGSSGGIRRRDLNTGAVDKVPFTAAVSYRRPAYKSRKYAFDATDRLAVKGIANPVLSPDGTTVAFVALNQLWTMRIGQKPVAVTDDAYYPATPFWSPDGSQLAYSSDREGPEAIYLRDMATGRERRLTDPFDGAQVRGAWSPDGKKIAFLSATTGSGYAATYVVDVATGSTRQVVPPLFEPGRPTWGPDSTRIALAAYKPYSNRFREGQSLILTVDVTTGASEFHNPYPWNSISNRKGDDGPAWSPDGRSMAYVLDGVLWVLPVKKDGRPAGKQRQITEENADAVSWSGDSRTLLYLSNGTLRTVPVSGGRPSTVPVDLTWRPDRPTGVTVIHAGALWDGESERLQHDVDIVVENNRIVGVEKHQRGGYGPRVDVVDASDLTVMPGLIEAHGHEQMDQPYVGGRKGRFMLAMGVTSVMGMGDPAYEALEQSESERSGARLTPRYFWAAESIDGERVNYDFMRVTANEKSLHRQLERIEALQPNILKTYVRLRNDWQAKAIEAGHRLGLPSFSHYVWPAMAYGQDSCSHYATQRLGYQLPVSASNISYDDTIQLHAQSGMAVELTRGHGSLVGTYPGIMDQPRTRTLLNTWQYRAMREQHDSELTPEAEASIRQFVQDHVRILRAGGTVLGGTDEPLGLNVWGLQPTLAGFVRWGFTPYEALRTVTALPPRLLGLGSELGTVQPGRLADLSFVRGNPLENIRAAADVEMVMKNGRLYTVEDLMSPYAGVDLND